MGVWLTELRRNLPPDIILHVVGTKSDLVAQNPSLREVPFERCIAYVAENLAPGVGGTPPPTATPAGEFPPGIYNVLNGAKSPSSKRSSGFWGQEVGWDCCHEVSAESGEGVEEVFRVITRKLVEQNRVLQEGMMSAVQTPGFGMPGGMTPGVGADGNVEGYFDGIMGGRPNGSFRVGRDRRSWFGVPVEQYVDEGAEHDGAAVVKTRRKCC